MSSDHLVHIEDLRIEGRRGREWSPIIKGVDLTLERGKVLGLVGESGAGKSTMGLSAMGYVRPGCRISGGRITFDGTDLTRASEPVLRDLWGRRIAYVAQSAAASFNPAHRILRQHCEAPQDHGTDKTLDPRKDAVDLYRRMRLPDPERIGERFPHQVSGGQLQRMMTAMAMACRPDLIIFDEPTTALDVTTQIEVLASIRRIVKEFGTAAIYITHDLAVVAQMADTIKVMRHGETVEEGPVHQMLHAPQQDYTKSLWSVRALKADQVASGPDAVPRIRISNVTAAYGAVKVLDNVSLDVPAGRTTAIVGESGSGKSTLARVVCGLLPPSDGVVEIDGKTLAPDYRSRSKEGLRSVQLIYQMADTALNPRKTVRELIGRPAALYLGLKGAKLDARIRELMKMVDLDPDRFMQSRPGDLSGGQKQRVGLARALAAEPSVIICDEVTSALDQIVAVGVLKLLADIQKKLGLTYIFITHDFEVVEAIAHEVAVMQRGEIVAQGSKEVVLNEPLHPYVAELLRAVPQRDENWLSRVTETRLASINE
ncbi:ABC transporter ATP-binding protein [Roseovarius sp.]|uniref:ABC transporter ATP-binding protein n=1 Tax=Roseovarius sp. TaxID=1486281 RepID=UPI000C47D966|nr:ABC transporter ATP-binding protein [Roseovarius sp.]MAZ21039.1 ABC transporter [Roseovarius sp.]